MSLKILVMVLMLSICRAFFDLFQELMVVLAVLDQGVRPDQQVLLEILVNRVHQDPQDLKDLKERLGQREALEMLDQQASKDHLGLLVNRACQVRLAVQEPKEQRVSKSTRYLLKFSCFLIVGARNLTTGKMDDIWNSNVK